MSASRPRPWIVAGLFAGLFTWLVWREWYYSAWMDDDAFISFRYARNLVRGSGLVFNPGERVEGYTNFLWTLILAGAHRLGADIPRAAQGIGMLLSILTIVVLAGPGRRLLPDSVEGGSVWMGFLAATVLSILEPWAVWAVGGLENTLGSFLVLAAFLTYFEAGSGRRSPLILSGSLCALAALTNPSFALFGVILVGHLVLARPFAPARLVSFVAPILLLTVPWLAWKYAYYGHLLPNTFRAKVALHSAVLLRGMGYFFQVAVGLPVPILAVIAAPFVLRRYRVTDSRPWLLFAASAGYCGYGVVIGGDAFPTFRLLVVTLPLQLLLLQYLLALMTRDITRSLKRRAIAALIVLAAFLPAYSSPRVRELDNAIALDMLGLFRAAALKLREAFQADILFASSGAGVIPYYSELRLLDTLGLVDEHIAERKIEAFGEGVAGHEKGDGRYVFERNPDVIMFGSGMISGFKPCFVGDYELVAVPGFHERYRHVVLVVRFFPHGGPIEARCEMPLFVKNGTAVRDRGL